MQGSRIAKTRGARALLLVAALAGCTLPRSGPTISEIKSAGNVPGYDMHVVNVTPTIAAAARSVETLGFGSDFVNASTVSPDQIRPGDKLAVRVWENVDTGLLVGAGQKATSLEGVEVDESGNIFVPYAGRIEASGNSPDQLRRKITDVLQAQTPDPQVEVVRVAGDGSTVSVMGGIARPGVYPIQAPTLRLTAMLAQAGGVSLVPDIAQVKIERRGKTGRVWLQDLYDNPRMDIALRPGDRIIVEEDRRAFTVLGATTKQERVPFNSQDMTALEALAAAGGLNGASANPTGVFVFRQEPSSRGQPRPRRERPRRRAADGLSHQPDQARGAVLGPRVRHPGRRHRLRHRGPARLVDADPRGRRDRPRPRPVRRCPHPVAARRAN